MGVFRQLGDPLAGAVCLCEHHGAAYAEMLPVELPGPFNLGHTPVNDGAVIVQVQITITERCCLVVNAATLELFIQPPTGVEIERPLGTIRTAQEDAIISSEIVLFHHAAWEVLDPGAYTYYLVNRSGGQLTPFAAWIKAIASDCEG